MKVKTKSWGMWENLDAMNHALASCTRCSRLVKFRSEVLVEIERKGDEVYWRKPVPGFGDVSGKLLVLGLAPAARGGNRTGRVFTGDKSSDFLVSCLHEAGLSNQPTSSNRGDGLRYLGMYLSAAVKCVPPDNKPAPSEIENCLSYLKYEIMHMKNIKAVLALGSIAFHSVLRAVDFQGSKKEVKFVHGAHYDLGGVRLYCSYHPSPRNVNTHVLDRGKFLALLDEITDFLNEEK